MKRLPDGLSILYLHGFASGPQSRKARFFAERLKALPVTVQIPDLAEGNFESLTISRQLKLIEELIGGERCLLIGSSLGGYLAALYAADHAEVARALLLAPAFGFYQIWKEAIGPGRLAEWRREGTIPVFHYGEGREMPLGYSFLEDAAQYPPFPDMQQPALLVHGTQDRVVPVAQSIEFARTHPHSRLICYESGHELSDVLENIWQEAAEFLTTA
jgi:pimeloyl-ACP methyl ester carboxylesterase